MGRRRVIGIGNPLDSLGQRLTPLVEGLSHAFAELAAKMDQLTAAIVALAAIIDEDEE